MQRSIHAYVLRKLKESRGNLPQVAEASGLPLGTVRKISSGESADPKISTIEKLVTYFENLEESE